MVIWPLVPPGLGLSLVDVVEGLRRGVTLSCIAMHSVQRQQPTLKILGSNNFSSCWPFLTFEQVHHKLKSTFLHNVSCTRAARWCGGWH